MPKFDPALVIGFKHWISVTAILFISFKSISQTYPVDTLMRNGERGNRINLVYLSDGYQAAQLPTYITNATTINDAFFAQSPFVQYKDYFNSYAIRVPSVDSGAKHPGTASDESSSGGQPVANPDNNFQSTFDFFSIHRLLVPLNSAGINNALASNLPDYTQAFIVVNSPYYGGSGGSYATASADGSSAEVAIHEIGHSFASLADEYWAGDSYAGEKANMTATSNPRTVKWKSWVGINDIGVYAYGTSGTPANWYRPHQTCKMQYLGYPFCSVCTERFIDVFHQRVNMIDARTPLATSFTLSNTNPVDFSIKAVQTNPSTIGINWYLNGSTTPFTTDQFSVTLPFASFNNGDNTVRAEVIDNTSLSKSYLPGIGYLNNLTWTVNRPIALPIHLLSFSGRVNNNTALLNWDIDSPGDLQSFGLEKSRDGIHFTRLSSITGQALKRSYSYADEKLFAPYTFYRLNIVEKSGSSYYSNIIRLQNAFDKHYYKVYQDAAIHKYHLSVGITEPGKVSFKVTDLQGRLVLKKDLGRVEKQLDYDFDLIGKAAGIYFMTLHFKDYNHTIQLVAK
ncbi:MAG: M64 family metallopeptidase [Ferruginibacter sp.]